MLFCDRKLKDRLLKISVSKRDLYVEPSLRSKWSGIKAQLPEMYDTEGNNISVIPVYGYNEDKAVSLLKGKIKGDIKGKIKSVITNYSENKVRAYALTKLKEGYLRGNNGKLYTPITTRGTKRKVYRHIIYTNSGEAVEVTSRRTLSVTKGIDQIKGVERIGVEGKVLGVLKNVCKIWNLYGQFSDFVDLFTWAAANDHSKPIPIPMIGGIVELMMQDVDRLQAEVDQAIYRNIQRQLNEAKKKGLTAVRGLVLSSIFRDRVSGIGLQYQVYPITNNQLSEIMAGNIIYFQDIQYTLHPECYLLLRIQKDSRRNNMDIYMIETLFFNKK